MQIKTKMKKQSDVVVVSGRSEIISGTLSVVVGMISETVLQSLCKSIAYCQFCNDRNVLYATKYGSHQLHVAMSYGQDSSGTEFFI